MKGHHHIAVQIGQDPGVAVVPLPNRTAHAVAQPHGSAVDPDYNEWRVTGVTLLTTGLPGYHLWVGIVGQLGDGSPVVPLPPGTRVTLDLVTW